MIRLFLMILLLIIVAMPAAAQDSEAGYIGLFADPGGNDCAFIDFSFSIMSVFVIHMDSPGGADAVEFKVETGGNPSLIYIGDFANYPIVFGDSQTGIAVPFLGCIPSPNVIMEIQYLTQGFSPPCSELRVVPSEMNFFGPGFEDEIVITECIGTPRAGEGRGAIINPTPECSDCGGVPVAEEKSTWGSLKSLYR